MKKVCKYCGCIYETKSKKSYMCKSKECIAKSKKDNQYTTICIYCGKTFTYIGEKPKKYCSRECRSAGRKAMK